MALIEINTNPSRTELRWFGLLFLAFFAIVGGIAWWRFGAFQTAVVLWSMAAVVTLVYYLVAPVRKPLYVGWMYAVFPIGLTISFVVLAITYFLVLTPIGLLLRLFRVRFFDAQIRHEAKSYWIPHKPASELRRYFQQF